ncbi:MAG: hypothetical protein C0483_20525 [Pirellula sp.]|nr:hypothetical protein [Pirellula sp.]
MAESLSVDVKTSLAWLFQDVLELSTVTDVARLEYATVLGGAPANEPVDLLWHDERAIAAGAHDDLVLSDLAKTLFGQAVSFNFARVRALLIVNLATAVGHDLWIGGAGAHAWGAPFGSAADLLQLPSDSCLSWVAKRAGWDVEEGTSDTLRIANPGGAAVTYRIALVGESV